MMLATLETSVGDCKNYCEADVVCTAAMDELDAPKEPNDGVRKIGDCETS